MPLVPGTKRRRIDIAFPRLKVAVFVDGCYWHNCALHGPSKPLTNGWYWDTKLAGNVARDADTNRRLADDGWVVLRFWEHDDADIAATLIDSVVKEASIRLTASR